MFRLTLFILFCVQHVLIGQEINFAKDIAPLLTRRCLTCHAGVNADGNLDLSSKKQIMKGGESGPAISPGEPTNSLAWRRIAANEMPEDKPLSDKEKILFRLWIEQGAKWSGDKLDPRAMSTDVRAGFDWWSLKALTRPIIPAVKDASWVKNDIDRFILHKLESTSIKPSPPATRHQLVRRLNFDVIGLPPNPNGATTEDLSNTIARLLSSKEFGQHWARHWLDIVRFGESHGFEYNQPRNHAWAYRNWVIDAINKDLPYDDFVRQQVAADVLYPQSPERWAATGFLVAGPHNTTKPSSDKMRRTMRHDELEDIVGTIGQTFLGLTINCARCHDHKFDPITQKEYYQVVASVIGIDHGERDLPDGRVAEAKSKREQIQAEIQSLRAQRKDQTAPQAIVNLQMQIDQLEKADRDLAKIKSSKIYMAVSRKPPTTHWLKRGDVASPIEVVTPAGLTAINRTHAEFGLIEDSGDAERRIKLAAWLTNDDNPLLARVIVNRIWHYYFGQGLVRTPSDFGFNGDRPSHPELLDFLAGKLIANRWRLKSIHRLILESATYQQSSRFRVEPAKLDAQNRLLWRMTPKRLTAEQLRDAMLSVSGKLETRLGGVGYRDVREYKYRGSHYYDPIEPDGPDAFRRTIYRFSPRGAKRTILDTFDCPDPSTKAPKRQVTTTPLQSLSLMNNRLVLQTSAFVAERLVREADSPQERLALLYSLAYNRQPQNDELKSESLDFVEQEGWAALCRVIFNSNEFLYVR